MRLSEWRAAAPRREAAGAGVAAVVDPVLAALGAADDPHCWVVWGEEPATRYTILVPTDPGLVVCHVRVMVPGEGPRASGKLVRWSRVAIGELGVEVQHGHRLLSFQVEQQILRGVDAEADDVAAFARRVIAAIDGRPLPPLEEAPGRRRAATRAPASARGPKATAGTTASAETRAPTAPSSTRTRR
jgi:hypothetical protein